jgi:hypothetical protein
VSLDTFSCFSIAGAEGQGVEFLLTIFYSRGLKGLCLLRFISVKFILDHSKGFGGRMPLFLFIFDL